MASKGNMLLECDEKLMIASKAESLLLVERLVEDVCTMLEVKEEIFANALIAVTEAVNNAIFHGNKGKSEKFVTIKYDVTPDALVFYVKDEGNGFNIHEIPDPLSEGNEIKPGGRGIFIMKKLSDKLDVIPPGNQVVLHFKLN